MKTLRAIGSAIGSWIVAQRLLLVALAALGLIAWGCFLIYPPAAPLAVGLLVLIDLARKG